jgi:hypothetical protein
MRGLAVGAEEEGEGFERSSGVITLLWSRTMISSPPSDSCRRESDGGGGVGVVGGVLEQVVEDAG